MGRSQKLLPSRPGIHAGLAISVARVRSFPGAHETVAGAFVGDRLESFSGRFHLLASIGKRRANAGVVARVETVHGRGDARHGLLGGRRPVEDERGGKIGAMRCKAEALAPAPAEACYEQLAVGGGNLAGIIGHGVEVRGDLVRIKMAHGLNRRTAHASLPRGEGAAPAAVRSHARKQVGRHRDVTGFRHLVSQILHPIRHPENLMNDEHHGGLVLCLGVDDEGFHRAPLVLYGDPLTMSRRFLHPRARPVLGQNG